MIRAKKTDGEFPIVFPLSNEGKMCYNKNEMRLDASKQEKDRNVTGDRR